MKKYNLTDLVERGRHARKEVTPTVVVSDGEYPEGTILDANSTQDVVKEELSSLIDGAPETLDTLKELAEAIATTDQGLSNYVTKQELEQAFGVTYGIYWTSENTCPTRCGNTQMHKTLPIQSKMRRCMLQDDGTVYGYIDPADYTKYTNGDAVDYSGAHGQYCVEIPEYWYIGTSAQSGSSAQYTILLSPTEQPDMKHSPKYYVGAVEASTNDADSNDSTKKMFSICMAEIPYNQDGSVDASNITTYHADASKYLGGNRNTSYTGVKSLLGRPATYLTRAAFRTKASARGEGWSQQYWDAYMAWVRLYVVEYCNFNSQESYNPSKTPDGYTQGGLGSGVSTVDSQKWNTFNAYNPFVPCGITRRLGNTSGAVTYNFAAGEFQSTAVSVSVPSYRGIENPFGHIWKWTDGLNAYCDGTSHKTSIYTCSNISNFADDTSTNYTLRTSNMQQGSEGYIKTWNIDENADFIPLTIGGSENSYLYDYSHAKNTGWRVLCSGGRADGGAYCGLFYFNVSDDSSYVAARIGGRLYYTPQN